MTGPDTGTYAVKTRTVLVKQGRMASLAWQLWTCSLWGYKLINIVANKILDELAKKNFKYLDLIISYKYCD